MINVAPKLLKKTDFGTGLMSESPFFQHIPTQYHDVLTKESLPLPRAIIHQRQTNACEAGWVGFAALRAPHPLPLPRAIIHQRQTDACEAGWDFCMVLGAGEQALRAQVHTKIARRCRAVCR